MGADRVRGQVQRVGGVAIGGAAGHQVDHAEFGLCQAPPADVVCAVVRELVAYGHGGVGHRHRAGVTRYWMTSGRRATVWTRSHGALLLASHPVMWWAPRTAPAPPDSRLLPLFNPVEYRVQVRVWREASGGSTAARARSKR